MTLSNEQKKHFRSIGHTLKPTVTVAGKGLSEGVMAELERALEDHELVKVKLALEEKSDRNAITDSLCAATGATLVQSVGKMALIFRAATKPDPAKSRIR